MVVDPISATEKSGPSSDVATGAVKETSVGEPSKVPAAQSGLHALVPNVP